MWPLLIIIIMIIAELMGVSRQPRVSSVEGGGNEFLVAKTYLPEGLKRFSEAMFTYIRKDI